MPRESLHMMLMPSNINDHETWKTIARYHLIYSLAELLLGCVCIIGGITLFLHGVVGSTIWTAKIIGAESHIVDAAPGAVLFHSRSIYCLRHTLFSKSTENAKG